MLEIIEEARVKCARYYRTDLHLHSPLSFDWKNDPDNPILNKIASPSDINDGVLETYLNALKEAHIDVVAITDHMKYSFGIALSKYAAERNENILILPGIEINVRINIPLLQDYRIHVISIFPPTTESADIEKIFPTGTVPEERRTGNEEIEFASIQELIDKIHEPNGKAIAAHIYSTNGVRLAYTRQAELILKSIDGTPEHDDMYRRVGESVKNELYKFDALQVTKTTKPLHYQDGDGNLFIPLILASDSHSAKVFNRDESISYMKMGSLDIHSLCEVFKLPDTRVRYKSNLPLIKPPRIRGIRIIGNADNEKSFFDNIVIGLSDNLTCIVGPRGSGKSAIIDAIRYAMGYNRSLNEIPRVKDQVLDRQRHTLDKSKIELLYEKEDSTLHKITSIYDDREDYTTRVYDLDDNSINIVDVEASGEYPLNLYGWNELELLGENPQSQRENLDRFIKEVISLKSQKKELYSQLEAKSNECLTQVDGLNKYFDLSLQKSSFTRLKEFENEFNKLNTEEIAVHFGKIDEITQRLSFLEILKDELTTHIDDISKMSSINIQPMIDKMASEKEWCNNFIQERLKLSDFNDDVIQTKSRLEGVLNGILHTIELENTTLSTEIDTTQKEIRKTIGEEVSISADLRNNAKKRFDEATVQYDDYCSDLETLKKLLGERVDIIKDIESINERIFAKRNGEINNIESEIDIVNDANFKIGLKLNQGRDRLCLFDILMNNDINLTHEGQWKKRKIPELICSKHNPIEFGKILLDGTANELEHKTDFGEIDEEYASKLYENNVPHKELEELNVSQYDKGKLTTIFKIQNILFDDEFYIELNGKPIQYCSPGQRCSAMLPIVTLTSDAPIIIDQPEDNLDNRLVSKAIYRILSKLKETRQIIVATHNPNILVSGDAEQVIVLNSNGSIENSGSIDERKLPTKYISA